MEVIVTITIMVVVITMVAQMILSVIKVRADIITAINIITVDLEEVAMVTLEEIKLQHRSETSKCSRTQHVIKLTMPAPHSSICSRCRVELNRAMVMRQELPPLQTTQATTPNTMAIKLQQEQLQAMYKVELLSTTTDSIISMTKVPLPQLQPPQPISNKQQLPMVTTTISNTTTTTMDNNRHLSTGQPLCPVLLRLHKLQPCSSQVISRLNSKMRAIKITTRLTESSIEV